MSYNYHELPLNSNLDKILPVYDQLLLYSNNPLNEDISIDQDDLAIAHFE